MFDTEEILKRKLKFPENMKQGITIIGEVVQVKTKDACLKDKVESKVKPVKEQDIQTKSGKKQKQGVEELDNIQLMKEIQQGGAVDMRDPLEVVSVGDGTVILVDKGLNYLQRINTEGDVVRKYQMTLNKQEYYKSACVYGDCLFVASSDNVITKMSLEGSAGSIKYKPEGVITLDYISAVGDNVILISDGGLTWTDGRILEYNTETNQVIQRLSGIGYPRKVSVVQDGIDTKYIVKYVLSGLWAVNIHIRNWNQITAINMYADALTVTPGGKLLIVSDNRIHEYSQDGTFIKGLLDKYRFE